MKTVDFTGTVSHGTMRPQDLIPEFVAVLEAFYPEWLEGSIWNEIPNAAFDDDEHEWWMPNDCAFFLNEELFDAMNEIAPSNHYFGAHPGDGSDYGFWMYDDEENEDEDL